MLRGKRGDHAVGETQGCVAGEPLDCRLEGFPVLKSDAWIVLQHSQHVCDIGVAQAKCRSTAAY